MIVMMNKTSEFNWDKKILYEAYFINLEDKKVSI